MKISNTSLLTLTGIVGGTLSQVLSSGLSIPSSKEEWRGLLVAIILAIIGCLAKGTEGSDKIKKGVK